MAGQTLKPPFAYYGGKTFLAEKIAALLPEHDHYVEPFAGSLAVLMAKEPSSLETVNDLDGDIVTFWRVLRDHPEALEAACALTPNSYAEYKGAFDRSGVSDVEHARRVWVGLTQGFRAANVENGWKYVKNSKKLNRPVLHMQYISRFAPIADRLRNVSLECRDAVDVIDRYGTDADALIYADPPYLGSTRAEGYGMEMLGDDLHSRLAEALNNCKASVVLSGYASPLYEELFSGWHRTELKPRANMAVSETQNEVLWSNVPLGQQAAFDFGGITA